MSMFLQLTITGSKTRFLINVDHIVRIHPQEFNKGSLIVTDESDTASLQVTASVDDIQIAMLQSNGEIISRSVV